MNGVYLTAVLTNANPAKRQAQTLPVGELIEKLSQLPEGAKTDVYEGKHATVIVLYHYAGEMSDFPPELQERY